MSLEEMRERVEALRGKRGPGENWSATDQQLMCDAWLLLADAVKAQGTHCMTQHPKPMEIYHEQT